jgi:hypothetical protein
MNTDHPDSPYEGEPHTPQSLSAALRAAFRPTLVAYRAYGGLFILIQAAALLAVLTYYHWPAFKESADQVAAWHSQGGVLAVLLSGVLTGVVIPELMKLKYRPKGVAPLARDELALRVLMISVLSVLVYYFYQLQNVFFGAGADPITLAKKLIVDQTVFSFMISNPWCALCYLWRDNGYRLGPTLKDCTWESYRKRALPLWMMSLTYWPVMVVLIYALPPTLQFILFLFANTAWALVMMLVASQRWQATEQAQRP